MLARSRYRAREATDYSAISQIVVKVNLTSGERDEAVDWNNGKPSRDWWPSDDKKPADSNHCLHANDNHQYSHDSNDNHDSKGN